MTHHTQTKRDELDERRTDGGKGSCHGCCTKVTSDGENKQVKFQ